MARRIAIACALVAGAGCSTVVTGWTSVDDGEDLAAAGPDAGQTADDQPDGGEPVSVDEPVELAVTGVSATSGLAYQVAASGLAVGAAQYIDRDYAVTALPADLNGAIYIRTANDDKQSSGSAFLTFEISAPAVIWVAHDDRVARPDWLAGAGSPFTDAGVAITNDDSGPFALFSMMVDEPGTVTLGANGADTGSSSMYTVAATPL